MSTPALDILRDANRNLRLGLVRLQPDSNIADPLVPSNFSSLLAQLMRVAECLRDISSEGLRNIELAKELSEYRANLQELAQVLPIVHGRLLTEKTRLEIVRSHVHAAASWTQLSQKTL